MSKKTNRQPHNNQKSDKKVDILIKAIVAWQQNAFFVLERIPDPEDGHRILLSDKMTLAHIVNMATQIMPSSDSLLNMTNHINGQNDLNSILMASHRLLEELLTFRNQPRLTDEEEEQLKFIEGADRKGEGRKSTCKLFSEKYGRGKTEGALNKVYCGLKAKKLNQQSNQISNSDEVVAKKIYQKNS